ncbi:ANT(4')-I family aminoglycoside nucleotidyltransferase [Alicyclobacillus fodiniaquatilis]|uniref:ANT(4')-I family aminoglycoside nucleotidyltransferase n=1 Tax=Alicyclobacillus fodiniaquatilis TaxID=1661150 RepID=A0ABW4JI38_9BACL
MNISGPKAISRSERLQTCREIAKRLHEVYGSKIQAIGVYGSVAKGTDGCFSDIEMFCVLHDSGQTVEYCYEWSAGPWRAEVDVYSANILLKNAATVKGRWPLTHGAYFSTLSLYDPDGFFHDLRTAVESPAQSDFNRAINEVLINEYEFMGKLRNLRPNGPYSYLPYLAMQIAHYGAMLVGLHNQSLFSTGAKVLPEALALPNRPHGFDTVAELVMSGELAEHSKTMTACGDFWDGIVDWADEHHYTIDGERMPF